MEQHSHPESRLSAAQPTLEGQLREMYGRVAYTHKTHEKMADICIRRYGVIKRAEITLAALASGSLLLAVFGNSRAGTIVGAVISTVILGFTLYFKEAALGERAQKHSAVAAKLWGLRERLLSLLIDMREFRGIDSVREERDAINIALEEIYANAPRTCDAAYKRAQEALKSAEELSFSEEELDRLLPERLRSEGAIGPK